MGVSYTNFTSLAVGGSPVLPGSGALGIIGDGKTFYVDPGNGSDGFLGETPSAAKATMEAALGRCVANRGDVIVRLPGTETVSAPVVFEKAGVTVVAASYGSPDYVKGENFYTYNNSATGLSAVVINDPVRIMGLGFIAADVSEEAVLVDCEEQGGFNGGFVSLEHCRIGVGGGALACGIRTIGGAMNHILNCSFDGIFTGWAEAAIIMEGDTGGFTSFYPRVIGCRFARNGSGIPCIKFATGSAPDEVILAHNYLGSEGVFLDNNSEVSDGIAVGNYLGVAAAADGGTAVTNTTNMAIKFSGNYYLDA